MNMPDPSGTMGGSRAGAMYHPSTYNPYVVPPGSMNGQFMVGVDGQRIPLFHQMHTGLPPGPSGGGGAGSEAFMYSYAGPRGGMMPPHMSREGFQASPGPMGFMPPGPPGGHFMGSNSYYPGPGSVGIDGSTLRSPATAHLGPSPSSHGMGGEKTPNNPNSSNRVDIGLPDRARMDYGNAGVSNFNGTVLNNETNGTGSDRDNNNNTSPNSSNNDNRDDDEDSNDGGDNGDDNSRGSAPSSSGSPVDAKDVDDATQSYQSAQLRRSTRSVTPNGNAESYTGFPPTFSFSNIKEGNHRTASDEPVPPILNNISSLDLANLDQEMGKQIGAFTSTTPSSTS